MKKYTLIIVAFFAAISASAQVYSTALINTDATSVTMGSASMAGKATAFAAVNNASMMALADGKFAIEAAYNRWSPSVAGANIAGLGTWFKIGNRVALGIDAKLNLGKAYDIVNMNGATIGSFKPMDIQAGLGASFKIIDGLSAGVSAKLFTSSIADKVSGTAFGADINISYNKNGLSAAAGVANLGSKMKYDEKSIVALPSMAKVGIAYSIVGLTISGEFDYLFKGGMMAGAGLEYNVKDIAFIRAGYHYGSKSNALASYASAGLGLKFFGVNLNFSYLFASKTLGNSMFFGLGYSF